ncbi:paraquat-inducible protein A [Amphritea sp. 2_MG-2023]|jgi:paraquat-inducible protein A|uniref:paraquat-inducible protein A n=1 Tax=Amphritea TaxID=515417 RepID=UPI001C067418|nr:MULTISPECIES: paraquat-inducible protein A [Amphritea]MBU2963894.1 paraquat-inducible protein A [Amphritea atlantica]MDO6419192.1 paraquat-inducible protein A [Amphritea sp. 2_MG-2023]
MSNQLPRFKSARESGYLLCIDCEKLHPLSLEGEHCDRCGARLHSRVPNSMNLSWASLIAAVLLFLPANLLPIMTFKSFGQGEPSTILSGIIHLLDQDMLLIGLIVLIASIVVPVLKIIAMTILLCTVQFRLQTNLRQKTLMFRIVEWIGRWSMLDVFVIGILVALVQLGNIAHIEGNDGATAFAVVVLLTMFSAIVFDTRLIWDNGVTDSPANDDQKDTQ